MGLERNLGQHAIARPASERFWAFVQKTDDCWIWHGWLSHNGYGRFGVDPRSGKKVFAHRFAYELVKGPIPLGLQIDHLCRVRNCVNPDHLEAVTASVNQSRGNAGKVIGAINMAKTHCPHGHEYTPENTLRRPDRPAHHRECRACRDAKCRAWRKA